MGTAKPTCESKTFKSQRRKMSCKCKCLSPSFYKNRRNPPPSRLNTASGLAASLSRVGKRHPGRPRLSLPHGPGQAHGPDQAQGPDSPRAAQGRTNESQPEVLLLSSEKVASSPKAQPRPEPCLLASPAHDSRPPSPAPGPLPWPPAPPPKHTSQDLPAKPPPGPRGGSPPSPGLRGRPRRLRALPCCLWPGPALPATPAPPCPAWPACPPCPAQPRPPLPGDVGRAAPPRGALTCVAVRRGVRACGRRPPVTSRGGSTSNQNPICDELLGDSSCRGESRRMTGLLTARKKSKVVFNRKGFQGLKGANKLREVVESVNGLETAMVNHGHTLCLSLFK
ncbi:basic proline-rich protein-like [Penaeus monodon]|uniref:basic proline-rich protein-like n=1 Tax=Penaeus monodon TaxID=6687 RepID=UPI0018A78E70|nr:basic proline-rich protein-like [Penaeus monodon]